MGIAKAPCLAYGVSQSLFEEGLFSVVATSLGPNLCLLKETNEGDLDLLLQGAGEWKNRWFKEVRKWRKTDAK